MKINSISNYRQSFGIKVSDKMARNVLIQAEPVYGIKGALRLLSYLKKTGGKNGNLEEFKIIRHKGGEIIYHFRYNLYNLEKNFSHGIINYPLEKNEKGFYTFNEFRQIGSNIEENIEELKKKNNIFNKLKALFNSK